MAQRITITIPDNLHDRLQAVKDRINVSGICQEAIMKSVELEELKDKDLPAIQKLAERLAKEKEIYIEKWKKEGLENGTRDAENWDYPGFLALERAVDELETPGNSGGFENILSRHLGYSVRYEWGKIQDYMMTDSSFDIELYLEGWLEGIMSVWARVKEHI